MGRLFEVSSSLLLTWEGGGNGKRNVNEWRLTGRKAEEGRREKIQNKITNSVSLLLLHRHTSERRYGWVREASGEKCIPNPERRNRE
jgi:hypothetical protein